MEFIEIMLIILSGIGIALLILSAYFVTVIGMEDVEDITFTFNLLTILTGLAYIFFVIIIHKLLKK